MRRVDQIGDQNGRYSVVDTPAAGVLRVSVMLADIRRRPSPGSSRAQQAEPEHQPMLVMLITDSGTGEAVVLVRDLNRGNEFAAVARSDETQAREVLSDWVKMLCRRPQSAHRAGIAPSTAPI
jgi:hypothetical protein